MSASRWTDTELQLLGELLTGARIPDEPEAARMLAANPALAAEYHELAGVAGGLETAGRTQRDDLAEILADAPTGQDLALTGRFLQARASGPRRRWVPYVLAAAAVLLVAALMFLWNGESGRVPDDTVLNSPHLESAAPHGKAEDFALFTWRPKQPLEFGGHYDVEVFDLEDNRICGSEEPLTETSWRPGAQDVQRLEEAGSIRWRLTCRNAIEVEFAAEIEATLRR